MGRTINLEPASCGVGHRDSSLASAPPEGLLVDSAALTESLRSTLIDVVDRGRPTGLVLVSAEAIRLLHWQAGWVEQPERSLYELEPGQWRDYDAYVGHPGRTPDGMHVGTFDQRVDEWRDRFLTEAATAIGRGGEFGWHRLLLSGDKPVIDGFAARRASGLSASSTLTCCGRSRRPSLIALITRWTRPGAGTLTGLVNRAIKAASEGGKGALGWAEVLDSLVQHRVEHLVFAVNATPNHETLAPHVSDALGKPSAEMLVERALEHAVASGADVTTVPDDAGPLLSVGGVVATLRY